MTTCTVRVSNHLEHLLCLNVPITLVVPLLVASKSQVISVNTCYVSIFVFVFLRCVYSILFSVQISRREVDALVALGSAAYEVVNFLILKLGNLLLGRVGLAALVIKSFRVTAFLSVLLNLLFVLDFSGGGGGRRARPEIPTPGRPSHGGP